MQSASTLSTPATVLPVAQPSANTPAESALRELASPLVVLLGRDEKHRPHAARFVSDDLAGVETAARLMGLHLVAAKDETLGDLAKLLPAGRLFPASGKAFVPFVKAALYDRLLKASGAPDTPRPVKATGKAAEGGSAAEGGRGGGAGGAGTGDPSGEGGDSNAPANWAGISLGSTVLACSGPKEGWWEAVVLYTKADDRFILRWRDWPDHEEIERARTDLGLMPPGLREGLV